MPLPAPFIWLLQAEDAVISTALIITTLSGVIAALGGFIAVLFRTQLNEAKETIKFWQARDAAKDAQLDKLVDTLQQAIDRLEAQEQPRARR